MEEFSELLLIDKPKGITSFDVIRRLRRQYSDSHNGGKAPKMGHAGTLDPLATGLMIIGVGSGTKKLTDLVGLDKEYIAEVLIGERRTTGDMEGEIIEQKDVQEVEEILRSKISAALDEMKGDLTLPVSAYSAIKVDGVPMYKRARKAEKKGEIMTEVPVRTMRVDEAELLNFELSNSRAVATVRFAVSSGTYVRSLAEELGRKVSYPSTLKNLKRTRVGDFQLEDAMNLK